MVVGEPEVTRLRHSRLPLAAGSALRRRVESRGRKMVKTEASPHVAASWMFVLLVTAPNLQTMAVIITLFTVSACCLASHTHTRSGGVVFLPTPALAHE